MAENINGISGSLIATHNWFLGPQTLWDVQVIKPWKKYEAEVYRTKPGATSPGCLK